MRARRADWSRPRATISPDQMEGAIRELMGVEDRVVYYYLSDTKRMFRVTLG